MLTGFKLIPSLWVTGFRLRPWCRNSNRYLQKSTSSYSRKKSQDFRDLFLFFHTIRFLMQRSQHFIPKKIYLWVYRVWELDGWFQVGGHGKLKFDYRWKSNLIAFWNFGTHNMLMRGLQGMFFWNNFPSTFGEFSIETLLKENKPAVSEETENKNR